MYFGYPKIFSFFEVRYVTRLHSTEVRMNIIFGAAGRRKLSRGSRCTWRNRTPLPLCPPQIPEDVLGSNPSLRRRTIWATSRLEILSCFLCPSKFASGTDHDLLIIRIRLSVVIRYWECRKKFSEEAYWPLNRKFRLVCRGCMKAINSVTAEARLLHCLSWK
jgi:hypothetical protein